MILDNKMTSEVTVENTIILLHTTVDNANLNTEVVDTLMTVTLVKSVMIAPERTKECAPTLKEGYADTEYLGKVEEPAPLFTGKCAGPINSMALINAWDVKRKKTVNTGIHPCVINPLMSEDALMINAGSGI